jgi:hypothetical protein
LSILNGFLDIGDGDNFLGERLHVEGKIVIWVLAAGPAIALLICGLPRMSVSCILFIKVFLYTHPSGHWGASGKQIKRQMFCFAEDVAVLTLIEIETSDTLFLSDKACSSTVMTSFWLVTSSVGDLQQVQQSPF